LSQALQALARTVPTNPKELTACRAAADAKLANQFGRVDSLIAGGRHQEAQTLLNKIDERFGGFAAPRSMELAPP
jgi:hypothetical protein